MTAGTKRLSGKAVTAADRYTDAPPRESAGVRFVRSRWKIVPAGKERHYALVRGAV